MTGCIEETTWAEVEVGHIVRDKKDRLWTVSRDDQGILSLESAHPVEVREMWRPEGHRQVSIYVPDEVEALALLKAELGARVLNMIEEREHTIARALNWRVDPVPRKVVKLRDHIDWLHGANVDDVLRKHNGTAANPSDAKQKRATVQELCDAHDQMHADPDAWPQPFPHHHAAITP